MRRMHRRGTRLVDDTTGDGNGDDESIYLELNEVDHCVQAIAILVNIYSSDKSFNKDVSEAHLRVYDEQTNHVYCSYKLSNGSIHTNGIVFVIFERSQHGNWELQPLAQPCTDKTAHNTTINLWDCDTAIKNKIPTYAYPPTRDHVGRSDLPWN